MSKVSQFFKNRYMASKQDHMAEDYQHSDLGRAYGWWVLVNGKRVASLEYRSFLEELVHLYEVHVLDPDFSQIEQDPEKWASQDVVIESRYAENYFKKGLEMAPVGKGMIVVQNLFVPESYYEQQHSNIELFHDELLRNAEQSRMQNEKDEPDAMPSDLSASASAEVAADLSSEESDHVGDSAPDAATSPSRDEKQLEKQLSAEKKQLKSQELQIKREKLKAEKREKRRLEKEKLKQEQLEKQRLEEEKIAQEKAEAERLELERVAQVKLELEKAEALRLEQIKIQQEKQAAELQQRLQLEQQRLAQEREQLAILEKEKLSRERLEQEAKVIRKAEELTATEGTPLPPLPPLPALPPSSSIDKEAAWQNKLGGIPRQPQASQNTTQKTNDDSITEL